MSLQQQKQQQKQQIGGDGHGEAPRSEDISPFGVGHETTAGTAAATVGTAHTSASVAGTSSSSRRWPPFRRVMVFVDNAGADIVLGILPFVREMLRMGCEVVMVANSLPAINDITAAELRRCEGACG
jgi:hypothetical protein